MSDPSNLLTIGVIAERLGVPLHRVRYAIESRAIRDNGRAGNARVFSKGALEQIRAALAATGSAQEHHHG